MIRNIRFFTCVAVFTLIPLGSQGCSGSGDGIQLVLSEFGAKTDGGQGGQVLHVTSLAAQGPGSLREALEFAAPRIVVFDVGGTIDLGRERIFIREPHVTVDGLSGPEPGITIIRGGLSIRTHDVILQHLRVRPGDAGQLVGSGWEPDAIGLFGTGIHDVIIESCSLSWAVDENLGIFASPGDSPPSQVTVRDCIISEGLFDSVHSEGRHSRGALVLGHEIAIERCLFVHNARRSPRFAPGATGLIANNVIYNSRSAAIHLVGATATIVGNVFRHGVDTNPDNAMISEQGRAYVEDNLAFDVLGGPALLVGPGIARLSTRPFWRPEPYEPLPSNMVELHVELNAGARPGNRDAIDTRVVQEWLNRDGSLVDSQDDVGGYP